MCNKSLIKSLSLVFGFVLLSGFLLSGCSGGGKTGGVSKPASNLPEGQTKTEESTQKESTGGGAGGKIDAKTAYTKLSNFAKSQWAPDALLLVLSAPYRPVDPVENGVCISWTSTFYSPSKKETWLFHYYAGQVYKAGKPYYKDVNLSYVASENFANSFEVYEKAASKGVSKIKSMSLVAGMTSPYSKLPPQVGSLKLYWEVESDDGTLLYFDGKSLEQLK